MKWEEEFLCYSKTDFIKVLVRSSEMKTSSAERLWYKIRRKMDDTKRRVDVVEKEETIEPKIITQPQLHRFIEEDKEQPNALKMLELKDLMFYLKGYLSRTELKKYKWNNLQINFLIDNGYNVEDK
jgi:hypothetical protein